MPNVLVLCEGQTECEFCKRTVAVYMAKSDVGVAGTLVGRGQKKQGGIRAWDVYRKELLKLATGYSSCYVSILVDYYAMPSSWPGRSDAANKTAASRGRFVENALRANLESELCNRFVPCVQLHEFESLLFVDPKITALSLAIAGADMPVEKLQHKLEKIVKDCGSIEQINDSPETAPSKRIANLVRGYEKILWGVFAVNDIGIDTLRNGCPWLDNWIKALEGIADR